MSVRVVLGLMLLTGMLGCQKPNEFIAPPPPEVTIALPVEEVVQEYFETTGQTRAVKVVDLRARVTGYLQAVEFNDGDMVAEGQVLYRIDPATYEAAVESASAALEKATAQHHLAVQNLNRTKQMIAQQVVTESELDVRQAELDSTKADVSAAQASLRDARLNLSYTQIVAPFSGRIGHHMVDVGNLIVSGQTDLARIETVDPIHAYFTVSESDVLRFRQMERDGKIDTTADTPLEIELALGDSQSYQFKGDLDYSEFGVDPQTGTTERRAVFDNKQGDLLPGLFVRVRTPVGGAMKKLLVADQAISSDQRGDYLLLLGDDNKVVYRSVKTGIYQDGLRVIESGVQPEDRVIVVGLQKSRPGSEVNASAGLVDMYSIVRGETHAAEKKSESSPEKTAPQVEAKTEKKAETPKPESSPETTPATEKTPDSASETEPESSEAPQTSENSAAQEKRVRTADSDRPRTAVPRL